MTREEAIEILKPEDFYRDDHKEIYSAMLELYGIGEPIDFLTVRSNLEQRGTLEKVGSDMYLSTLIDSVPSTSNIESYVKIVEERSTNLLEEYKQKLNNRIKELEVNEIIDENRLGMEIVLFADKSSICEEVNRLKSHIKSLNDMLEVNGPIGKKLDFLLQEMNRETNTIGSKANCLDITNSVVEMKNEIENIREQIQNIE